LPLHMIINRNTYYYLQPVPNSHAKSIKLGNVLEPHRSPSESLKAALDKYKELRDERAGTETVGWLVKEWLDNAFNQYEPKTQRAYKRMCNVLSLHLGRMEIVDVRPVHIARFIDENFSTKPNTANKYKSLLSVIFAYAIRRGMRDTNPAKEVKSLRETKRKRYITDEELVRLIHAAPPMIKVIIALAALTGQRISDLLALKWTEVLDEFVMLDIEEAETEVDGVDGSGLIFNPAKIRKTTGKRVAIAMTEQLRAVLKQAREIKTGPSQYVVRKQNGDPYTYDGMRSAYVRAVEKAKREYLLACVNARRKPKPNMFANMHFHDLKRKALTDAENQKLDAQQLGGHADRKMTERYLEDVHINWITPPKMPDMKW
jgi:integrase